MLHKKTRFAIWALLSLWLLAGCASGSLPEQAQNVLDEHIAELNDSVSGYEVVSVQQASGAPEELNVNPIPEANTPGICPPDYGPAETWCVVIDQGIVDNAGRTISHFLVQKQGRYWDVENLTDSEQEAFLYAGCDNWDDTDKD